MDERQLQLPQAGLHDRPVADNEDSEAVRPDVVGRHTADVVERHCLQILDLGREVVVRQVEMDDIGKTSQYLARRLKAWREATDQALLRALELLFRQGPLILELP